MTEACWMLRKQPDAMQRLVANAGTGFLELLHISTEETSFIVSLLTKYSDLRPDIADACLVYLAEREGIDTIFTLDRRDFSVYRTGERKPFNLLP